jgi:putative phosphoribosyl transferase
VAVEQEGAEASGGARAVSISAGPAALQGDLTLPAGARGAVAFAHGSGSGRHSPRNRLVARELSSAGFATLLLDLLTVDEEREDLRTARLRFDIGLLAERVMHAVDWLGHDAATARLPLGLFGASTGAAAALVAAAARPGAVRAVVSRGGRPDLAGAALPEVAVPTLLIVGGADTPVIEMNRDAMGAMACERRLEIVPGATHLFEEPGTLETVARLARDWLARHLPAPAEPAGG